MYAYTFVECESVAHLAQKKKVNKGDDADKMCIS